MNKSDILNQLKIELNNRHEIHRVKIAEIKLLIDGYHHRDYKKIYTTNLYINEGGIYCYLLEVLNKIYNKD